MGAVYVEEIMKGSSGHGEKIFVSVRMRPLNGKEIARNDISDWECITDDTIIFRNNLPGPDRSMYPSAYTFDRVFGCDCSTRQVYEDGAKEVAFSALTGINSSIFAYGQTSSGKTYTMSGITENTMTDIYDYIDKHKEREFFLRFSAMEIYNESVRDLLSSDNTPLRLLDDPERGTIVEKLTEETLRDWNHLKELLSICEAQRKFGDTYLNETSSRSHQILKLTIESSARNNLGHDHPSTLIATVNFVDLAGSERASQSLSAGSRLKEGCHINRSLLTLGTVIRKLSKGRNGHVPFRDSKLTRILQSSLDGNARTAIICTMSPARSHVEQSRNTLLFASCAKDVTTNAQVNVVVSDKALVKHLQRELARLENELRISSTNSVSSDSSALLREKDLQIDELKKDIAKLTRQRDLAQSQASLDNDYPKLRVRKSWEEEIPTFDVTVLSNSHSQSPSYEASHKSDIRSTCNTEMQHLHFSSNFDENYLNNRNSPSRSFSSRSDATKPCMGCDENNEVDESTQETFDGLCKEVRCIDLEENSSTSRHKKMFSEIAPEIYASNVSDDNNAKIGTSLGSCALKKESKLSRKNPVFDIPSPDDQSLWIYAKDASSSSFKLTKSRSCKSNFMSSSSSRWSEKMEKDKNTPPCMFENDFSGRPAGVEINYSTMNYGSESQRLLAENYEKLAGSISLDEFKAQNAKILNCEDNTSICKTKDISKPLSEKKLIDTQANETEPEAKETVKNVKDVGLDPLDDDSEKSPDWPIKFRALRKEIIDLWDTCNVSLVHRTYFFLLFKGDITDAIYMEVELRRLSFLKNTFSRDNQTMENVRILTPASSMKALHREREMLSKEMLKKLTEQDRETLFVNWGIKLRSKNRRLQLVHLLWTDTNDMNHITQSAEIVVKLVGVVHPEQAYKEMFGLNFIPRYIKKRPFSWKRSLLSVF